MNQIALRGKGGNIRWSYHQAASIGSWEVRGHELSATVLDADTFRLSQSPLTFVVRSPKGHAWSWPIASVRVDGTTLYAALTPEERSE